ncbi:MAG TPA: hypothetical protein VHJ20_01560 [Polyangia bacterium]|nr:hypothetical protein [Polyangia bacterium]
MKLARGISILMLLLAPGLAHAKKSSPKSDSKSGDSASLDKSDKSDKSDSTDAATPTKTADGKTIKTKTYTFGAMDVEGKLKTPQLLYFLNRVKLELDMSAPDKRSFMKELARSADDKAL